MAKRFEPLPQKAQPVFEAPKSRKLDFVLPFKGINYAFFIAAAVGIVLGYLLLSKNAITLGPIVLVASYCVLIPMAIMWGTKKDETEA